MILKTTLLMIIVPVALFPAHSMPESPSVIRSRLESALKLPSRTFSFKSKHDLHTHIEGVARLYNLPANLLKKIVAVESANCRYKINKRTSDFGCFQLNAGTIKLYKWNVKAVTHNDRLNTVAAAIVLADLRKAFPNDFQCRYNVGWRNLPLACAAYLRKLSQAAL